MPDDQPNAQAPWWDQSIMRIGSTFGVPTLLLGYYLAQNAGYIPNPVEERLANIEKGMQQDAGHAIRHDSTMQAMVEHIAEGAKRDQLRCILKAHTDAEKKACFPSKE